MKSFPGPGPGMPLNERASVEALVESLRPAAEALGHHLRAARQARHWTQDYLAWRTRMSVPTLKRMEAGDPTVGLVFWLRAWHQFGLLDAWPEATAPHRDAFGERARGFSRATARVRRPSRREEDWDY